MYLLYLDDSGSTANKDEKYFVLGGVAVHENFVELISNQLDDLARSIDASIFQNIEFHASEIFSRKKHPWDSMNKESAQGVIKAVVKILSNFDNEFVKSFACAVCKDAFIGKDPVEMAFEEICNRFNLFLERLKTKGNIQKGLLIIDKSAYETTMKRMARDFKTIGSKWGIIKNLVDIPFFVDSDSSRLIQMADHISYSVFRRYNAKDTNYFDILAHTFDCHNGKVHGLSHRNKDDVNCMCLACSSRKL